MHCSGSFRPTELDGFLIPLLHYYARIIVDNLKRVAQFYARRCESSEYYVLLTIPNIDAWCSFAEPCKHLANQLDEDLDVV